MFETLTVEQIKTDILSRVSNLDTREGSFANDMVSAVAYRMWEALQSLDAVVPIAFVDETSGDYIDRRCAEFGIVRKPGKKAASVLTITGTDGAIVPEGTVFVTPGGLQFLSGTAATVAGGTAQVAATAAAIGAQYNVLQGTITGLLQSLSGVTAITNAAAAVGGTDQETDAALCARLYDYLQHPATSGNAYHYRQWAMAVDGVGDAKVTPLWAGAGTVKVLVVGNDRGPVDETIVSACSANIEANRPIGATVTVKSAEALAVNVSASVTVDKSTSAAKVQAAFQTALAAYLTGIAFAKYTLVYTRVGALLQDIDGVEDYTALTVNGGTANIAIGADQVPVLGGVTIT